MGFTWIELVGLCVINYFKDPELVIYFLKILKKERRNLLEEKARGYYIQHTPNMKKIQTQWYKLSSLEKTNYAYHIDRMRNILFLKDNFIKKTMTDDLVGARFFAIEASTSEKLKAINLIYDKSEKGINFRGQHGLVDIEEAFSDFDIFDEIYIDYPYLLIMGEPNNLYIDIIN